MNINDTAYPAPAMINFGDMSAGDVGRLGAEYMRKLNASQAYNFSNNAVVAIASTVSLVKVTAELVITPPTV